MFDNQFPVEGKGREPSREAILTADDTKIELVLTPEWPCDVYVKSISSGARDRFDKSLLSKDGKTVIIDEMRAKLVAKCACDKDGKRLFSDADVMDLSKKSAAALDRVFKAAQRLNGMDENAVKEATGELKNDQQEDSPSG